VRGEQKETSDLDILVDFEGRVGLFEIVRLERFLSETLGEKVDLVMKNSLKPRIGKAYPERGRLCMKAREYGDFLEDILDSINLIDDFLAEYEAENFINDKKTIFCSSLVLERSW